MSRFYTPKFIIIEKKPIIAYPCEGIEQILSRKDPNSVREHLTGLHLANREMIPTAEFHLAILWENKGDLMTDLWSYNETETWGSGALMDEQTFRKFQRDTTVGVTAGFGAILLGEEEKHRIFSCKCNPEVYLSVRPTLPQQLTLNENFYIN
jgi:hypothetical protein